jgi:hypothetical protein
MQRKSIQHVVTGLMISWSIELLVCKISIDTSAKTDEDISAGFIGFPSGGEQNGRSYLSRKNKMIIAYRGMDR